MSGKPKFGDYLLPLAPHVSKLVGYWTPNQQTGSGTWSLHLLCNLFNSRYVGSPTHVSKRCGQQATTGRTPIKSQNTLASGWTYHFFWCDLEQVTQHFCALVSSSVNGYITWLFPISLPESTVICNDFKIKILLLFYIRAYLIIQMWPFRFELHELFLVWCTWRLFL